MPRPSKRSLFCLCAHLTRTGPTDDEGASYRLSSWFESHRLVLLGPNREFECPQD
jgi:hypothetical protein